MHSLGWTCLCGGATIVTSPSLASLPKAYILKMTPSLEVFDVKDLGWIGLATTVESDGSYLYAGGSDLRGLSLVFRVDKPDESLSGVASYKSQGLNGYHLTSSSMAFNKVTGRLWIVGMARGEGDNTNNDRKKVIPLKLWRPTNTVRRGGEAC